MTTTKLTDLSRALAERAPSLPAPRSATPEGAALRRIEKDAGLFGGVRAAFAVRRAASYALVDLKTERLAADARLGGLVLRVAETKAATALLSASMTEIGALTVELKEKTAMVDLQLTASSAAETVTHLQHRDRSRAEFQRMADKGVIATEEQDLLRGLAESDCANDIARSRRRTELAKDKVDAVHDKALESLGSAAEYLKTTDK